MWQSHTLEVQKCGKMQTTLKIDDLQKSVLFCEYLRNERSDLYEILNLSFYVSNKLPHKGLNSKFYKDPSFCS